MGAHRVCTTAHRRARIKIDKNQEQKQNLDKNLANIPLFQKIAHKSNLINFFLDKVNRINQNFAQIFAKKKSQTAKNSRRAQKKT